MNRPGETISPEADQAYVNEYKAMIQRVIDHGLTNIPSRFVLQKGPLDHQEKGIAMVYTVPRLGISRQSILEFCYNVGQVVTELCGDFLGDARVSYTITDFEHPDDKNMRSLQVAAQNDPLP